MEDNIKLGNREGLEASKTSPNSNMPQKTTKTITSIHEKVNQRRERDSNPRDLAVTSFM